MSDYGTPPPPPPGSGYSMPPAPTDMGAPVAVRGELAGWPLRVGGYLIDSLMHPPGCILVLHRHAEELECQHHHG